MGQPETREPSQQLGPQRKRQLVPGHSLLPSLVPRNSALAPNLHTTLSQTRALQVVSAPFLRSRLVTCYSDTPMDLSSSYIEELPLEPSQLSLELLSGRILGYVFFLVVILQILLRLHLCPECWSGWRGLGLGHPKQFRQSAH